VEAELKTTLEGLARHLFGQETEVRWGEWSQACVLCGRCCCAHVGQCWLATHCRRPRVLCLQHDSDCLTDCLID
jgi:hypothetical protein